MKSIVRRDRWGIAHVDSPNAPAAFEAQGWIAASDRIWQMDSDRLKALGRWGEIVGPKGLKEDAFFRRLGLGKAAQDDWAALSPETRHMTESYAAGVNGWLKENFQNLPAEYAHHPAPPEPWEPWHCVAVYKVRHIFMGTLHRKLWRGHLLATAGPDVVAAMKGDPNQASVIARGNGAHLDLLAGLSPLLNSQSELLKALVDIDGGSNSWAVHGSRTVKGKPLLAGDPHRGIEFPNVYHQFHMECPEFNAIGLAFPGVPAFPHFGHNDEVAWCITHGMADDTDVFVETESLEAIQWASEVVRVRGHQDVEVFCGSTERGPVVIGDPADGMALSVAWTGVIGRDTTFEALRPMLAASSCEELENSVRPWVIPVNNLLTADRSGDISFKIRGRVVERPPGNRWTPVPGNAEHAWSGIEPVPFEQLPGLRNPERGFLVTANNRISNTEPYISLDFAGPARYDRIIELLEELPNASREDMKRIHADVLSLKAPPIVQLLTSRATRFVHPRGKWLVESLSTWDFQVAEDSVEASLFAVIRRRWCESVGERLGVSTARLGAPSWPSPEAASRMLFEGATTLLLDDAWKCIPGLETDDDLDGALSACIDETLDELELRLGENTFEWSWGQLHRMASPHPLASAIDEARYLHPPLDGCPGDGDTVRCGSVIPETGERAAAASVARYVFDLADWDSSGWIVPHGVSGVRGSGHDMDQRAKWLDCELAPMTFSKASVLAATQEQFEL
ncbi:MAG: penicillin acylase family protein [Acidimicrobiales bacterium]|nr:penicillin acylase family protein [Acidimicrobiales bacterium]